jgi:hypothetical protein
MNINQEDFKIHGFLTREIRKNNSLSHTFDKMNISKCAPIEISVGFVQVAFKTQMSVDIEIVLNSSPM